jgi:hypothetical protein
MKDLIIALNILCGILLFGTVVLTIEERSWWWFITSFFLFITFFFLFRLAVFGETLPIPLYKLHLNI